MSWRREQLAARPWLLYLLPFVVYMAAGALEPAAGDADYANYPWVYSFKVLLTLAAMAFVWPGYATVPKGIHGWSLVVGAVGVVVWVSICSLKLEATWLPRVGLGWLVDMGARPGFDPLTEMANRPLWAYTFLAVRLFGLAVLVPVIEEFFLRGFLTRFFTDDSWTEVPFGKWHTSAMLFTTGVFVLAHPGELLAAVVWFSLVTAMYVRTRSLWDCVIAHATTNLLLGAYVLASGDWSLM